MKTTGMIGLSFKDGVPESVVKRTIELIYSCNQAVIEGMSYREFNDEKTLSDVLKHVDSLKGQNEPTDSTLTYFVEGV